MKKITATFVSAIISTLVFSEGYYLEFKMSSGKNEGIISGKMKAYSQDENTRMEMNMAMPSAGNINLTSLILKSAPNTIFLLDETKKTYSELNSGSEEDYKDYPQNEYEVTVLGKEKVNGYNCTHAKVKAKQGRFAEEIWTSTEVVDYGLFAKMKSKYTGKENLLKALEAKGAAGFPVRTVVQEYGQSIQLDLVKAEKKSHPAGLFSLEGYSKSANSFMPAGFDLDELMQQLKDIPPAERERMLERLKEQYQNKPH